MQTDSRFRDCSLPFTADEKVERALCEALDTDIATPDICAELQDDVRRVGMFVVFHRWLRTALIVAAKLGKVPQDATVNDDTNDALMDRWTRQFGAHLRAE